MFIIIAAVVILTTFILITLRPSSIFRINEKNGKEELSYRALFITTFVIVSIWFVLYIFCSSETSFSGESLLDDWE